MADSIIEVQIKVYRETKTGSGRILGVKETAEVPAEGYVYVFRQIRPDEDNDDGTRTRLFETIDLSKSKRTTLPKKTGRYGNHYFFAYSRIQLSDPRISRIRLHLHDYINHKKQNSSDEFYLDPERVELTSRVTYIPIAHDMVDSRLFNASDRISPVTPESCLNADFDPNPRCNLILYLFDWYGYLDKLGKQYEDTLTVYQDKLNAEADLNKYYRGADSQLKKAFSEMGEKPTVGALYEMTKTVRDLAGAIGKKDNLRSSIDYTDNKSILHPYGEERNYDYELFLAECQNLNIDNTLQCCQEIATEIYKLLSDSQRSIHHCLYDYFYGTETQRDNALNLLGTSIQKNYCLLNENDASCFRKELLEGIEDRDDCFEASDIDEMVGKVGDSNIFNAALLKNATYFASVQSQHVLDTILQHAPYFTGERPGVYKIMKYKTFQNILQKDPSPILFIDGEGMQHWYSSNHPGSTVSHREANRVWRQNNDSTISQMTIEYKHKFETTGESALSIIEGPTLETHPDKLRSLLKGGMKFSAEVLEGFAFIFDGLNILEQIDVLLDLQKNDKANGALLSLAVSSLSVLNKPITYTATQIRVRMIMQEIAKQPGKSYLKKTIEKVATNQASKIVGAAGIAIYAVEVGFKAIQAGRNRDDNAIAMYSLSFGFAASALVISFVPGANVVVWVLLGISAFISILGSIFTDDPVDLFLKYSFWGKEFHSAPRIVPNWWINGRDGEESVEGFFISDNTYEETVLNFRDIEKEELDSRRLLDMDRNLEIMQKAIQIPQNTVEIIEEPSINYAASPYIKLRMGSVNFTKLISIKVRLLQSPNKRHRVLGLFSVRAPKVDANGMEEIFNQTYSVDDLDDGLCVINQMTNLPRKVSDYRDADAFELLFVPSFDEFRKKHAVSISPNDSQSQRYYEKLSKEEFKDNFGIEAKIIDERELRFDQNKVFEVTFSFHSFFALMPVIYRIGVNRT